SATPLPPNSSGMDMPMIPDWAALRHICRSTRWSSSHCSKCGTTSRSRKAATELRKASWSSLYRFLFIGSVLFCALDRCCSGRSPVRGVCAAPVTESLFSLTFSTETINTDCKREAAGADRERSGGRGGCGRSGEPDCAFARELFGPEATKRPGCDAVFTVVFASMCGVAVTCTFSCRDPAESRGSRPFGTCSRLQRTGCEVTQPVLSARGIRKRSCDSGRGGHSVPRQAVTSSPRQAVTRSQDRRSLRAGERGFIEDDVRARLGQAGSSQRGAVRLLHEQGRNEADEAGAHDEVGGDDGVSRRADDRLIRRGGGAAEESGRDVVGDREAGEAHGAGEHGWEGRRD